MDDQRKNYNTTLKASLIRKLKILSAETDKRQNDLLEEAIKDLLKKYEKRQIKKK
jgi:plasmid maintenance system killer protein